MKRVVVVLIFWFAFAAVLGAEPSPDGKLVLSTSVEKSKSDPTLYGCVILEIADPKGHIVHRENTRASSFQRWSIRWLSNDKIELQSSDIGRLLWIRTSDGKWRKEEPNQPPEPTR